MNDLVMIVSIMNTTEASSEGINAKLYIYQQVLGL